MKGENKNLHENNSIDFAKKKEVGRLGEGIACTFLEGKNFRIIERNYLKRWGEIDIIAVKDNVLTFIEVKSVIDNHSSFSRREKARRDQTFFRPEENVHAQKLLRLRRTIQTYMAQAGHGPDESFLFHVLVVRINTRLRRASVGWIKNVIL